MITVEVSLEKNFDNGIYKIVVDGVVTHSSKVFEKATINSLTFIGLVHALMIEHKTRDWRAVSTDIELMRYLINDKKHFKEEPLIYGVDINHYISRCNLWINNQSSHNDVFFVKSEKVIKSELKEVENKPTLKTEEENEQSRFDERKTWYNER
jgi:hypothetical protein